MSERDFHDFLLEAEGAADDVQAFAQRHLQRGVFSFDSIRPMPPSLDYEYNNFVSDGYDALFGDWTTLTERWMFKEAAAERGFPFPLQSRHQVLACIQALGEFGEQRLELGQRFKANLDQYGFGHADEWMKAHWGCAGDAGETLAQISDTRVRISCTCYGAPPRKLFAALSALHPALDIAVVSINEWGKRGAQFALYRGKVKTLPKISDEEASQRIRPFRREHGMAWYQHIGYPAALLAQIELNEIGRPVFTGAKVSLRLAQDCLDRGESIDGFAARFPGLSAAQVQSLALVQTLSRQQDGG